MTQQLTQGQSASDRGIPLPKRETKLARKADTQLLLGPSDAGDFSTRSSNFLRVLIVDDHHDTTDSLRLVLQMWGHEVCGVYSGADALQLIATFRPHIVLLDIAMPGMDGYAAARQIRVHDDGRGILLIAITGYGAVQDIQQARDAGFDFHVTKPFQLEALQALLSRLTDARR